MVVYSPYLYQVEIVGCSFRQLRSFRCSDLFVGSHISAFNFCKSQFRERVSQSTDSLEGLWPGSALTRAPTKVGWNLLPR